MKSVFLVDDEYLVLEGMSQLVDWAKHGARLCGTAVDGLSALEQIKVLKPDLVLTDIRMPGMSGLDLIREVEAFAPETGFVIISGYNDFEYIRMAIRLRVFDYIDKPMTVEKMEEVLDRYHAGRVIGEKPEASGAVLASGERVDAVLCELIHHKYFSEQDLLRLEEQYQVSLLEPSHVSALCAKADCPGTLDVFRGQLLRWLKQWNISTAFYPIEGGFCAVLYAKNEAPPPDIFDQWFMDLTEMLCVRECYVRVGASKAHNGLIDIPICCKEAESALAYAEFFDECYLRSDGAEYGALFPSEFFRQDNDIAFQMRANNRDGVLKLVQRTLDILMDANVSLDLFCHECLELIYTGLRVCAETGEEYVSREIPHAEIRKIHKAYEIGDWVCEQYKRMMDWVNLRKNTSAHRSVLRAKQYIDERYQEPITLESLSQMCGMHPSYFSMVFKVHIGKTYVKYVNQVRMEQAKKMILSGGKLNDVAKRVGFSNTRYFCDRFKVYFGCTPTQLKNMSEG